MKFPLAQGTFIRALCALINDYDEANSEALTSKLLCEIIKFMMGVNKPVSKNVLTQSQGISKFLVVVTILLSAVFAGAGGYLLGTGTSRPSVRTASLSSPPTVRPSLSISETSVPMITKDVSMWKTYTSKFFSIEYPPTWFVNRYNTDLLTGMQDAIEISDRKDSPITIGGMSNLYTRVQVIFYTGEMPTSFPYTNGSEENTTIRPFRVNGYTGIRGQDTSEAGLQDVVFLTNQKSAFASIILTPPIQNDTLAKDIFHQMLSTFNFR
jgi:hypothetical protein